MSEHVNILVPDHNPHAKGRPPFTFNLDEVRRLAALRLPEYAIANAIGISDRQFGEHKKNNPELLQAIRQGQADAQEELGKALREAALSKGVVGTAERIFLAKQPAERGGLGMVDRINHQHEGTVNHVVLPALDQWRQAKQIAQDSDLITDAEYEEID